MVEYEGSSRLLDATRGEARALYKLKKFDEAKKIYENILITKEWRGEAHAEALFMQGEMLYDQQKWGEAIPFYQRVFIAHQKWKSIMAKAYVQCARAFVKFNRPQELPDRTRRRRIDGGCSPSAPPPRRTRSISRASGGEPASRRGDRGRRGRS